MYTEWASLTPTITSNVNGAQSHSVLTKFSGSSGVAVTVAVSFFNQPVCFLYKVNLSFQVVKQLASNLGISQAAEPSSLVTDQEVFWCMDVISYGLSLPLTDHETIKDCVNVYCEWLTALHPSPRISVPKPICEDPNVYARKIICHLHNLFVPRQGEGEICFS